MEKSSVGFSLPSFSLTLLSLICLKLSLVLGLAHYLPTTWSAPSSIERLRRPTGVCLQCGGNAGQKQEEEQEQSGGREDRSLPLASHSGKGQEKQ